MEVVLQRVGLMFKTSLSLRRGFQKRFLLISPRILMIEVLILHIKRKEMLIHQKRDQLVVSVVRRMGESALLELLVTMVVERVAIW